MHKFLAVLQVIGSFPRRYLGAAIGFILWIFLEAFGFFPTLLLVAFVVAGYALGRFADSREKWQDVIERLWQTDRREL